ncbi:MAG TPA: hypothetical protein VFB99_16355 [Vicinamibacterales bacterium]|nr:hypothetical protein [Vicinamibacterales bacterium]
MSYLLGGASPVHSMMLEEIVNGAASLTFRRPRHSGEVAVIAGKKRCAIVH